VIGVDPLEFRIVSAHVADDLYVVTLAGELDLANVDDIDGELELIVREGARRVIVDLLEVPFIESRTLGVLMGHARRLRKEGGEMTLVSDDQRILRVIEITGLATQFVIEPSLAGAIDKALAEVPS
jgi:anti-sigma B factor antagonist